MAERISRTAPDHLAWMLARVTVTDAGYSTPCWLWNGCKDRKGYGKSNISRGGKRIVMAHRAAHETLIGAIPDGFEVDHLCFVKACCNPDHLEAVTPEENTRRAREMLPQHFIAPTHCKNGHPLTPENTVPRVRVRRRGRLATGLVCVSCRTINTRAYQARRRSAQQSAAHAAPPRPREGREATLLPGIVQYRNTRNFMVSA